MTATPMVAIPLREEGGSFVFQLPRPLSREEVVQTEAEVSALYGITAASVTDTDAERPLLRVVPWCTEDIWSVRKGMRPYDRIQNVLGSVLNPPGAVA